MKNMTIPIGFFLLLLIFGPAIADAVEYARYLNGRFAYGISYPQGILIPQGEPDNGDGQKFISKDGKVEMLAYGRYNALDDTLESVFKEESRSHTKDNPKRNVIYKIRKNNWFVVSGTEGENIFYYKVIYDTKDDKFINFYISYPKSQKIQFDPIAAYIGKSMKLLPAPAWEEESQKKK